MLDAAPPPPDLETMHGLESVLAQASILVTCTDITIAEGNQELVRRRYLVSYNEKWSDPEVSKLFSRRMTYNKAGTQAPLSAASAAEAATGISIYLDRRRIFLQAFPDMQFQILEQSAQGEDQVYTSWQWTGTHRGPYHYKTYEGEYRDLAPSGMRVHVQGIAVDVCRDGKIIDHAAYYDEANLRMQLQPSTGRSSVRMQTQLLLKVQEEDAEGRTCVRCRLHVAPLGAPRPDEHQLTAQAAMQRFYARKYLRQLAAFGADGFALSKACLEKAPLMLCTHAFARLLSGDKGRLSETSSQQAHRAPVFPGYHPSPDPRPRRSRRTARL